MKIAILGYAVDGASTAEYWHSKGADVTVCDQKTGLDLPAYATPKLGPDYLKNLGDFDMLIRTPGLHPSSIVAANPGSPDILKKVTTGLDEFFAICPAPIIAVTGTKGKGTTCTLIYKMLQAAGEKAFLGGNIGKPPLDFISEVTPNDYVVLEISNFQLIDFTGQPKVAVCLMLVPEHQDWHSSVNEYYTAKERLFIKQAKDDITVFNANNQTSKKITGVSHGQRIPYSVSDENKSPVTKSGAYVNGDTIYMQSSAVCKTSEVALLGRHNLENICAAIAAVWQIVDGDVVAISKVISEFSGMEHRLEFIREIDSVKYYNDSFATTPEATIAAIKAFKQPKVLILGGYDKGIPFYDLVNEVIKSNIRQVVVVGDTGEKIIELLVQRGFEKIILGGDTMSKIVESARSVAQSGDVVLLSTACASFGLFKNYKDRGDQFRTAVQALV